MLTELPDPEVQVNDRGDVRLTDGKVTIGVSADGEAPGWWYLKSPGCSQVIRTDDPEMVALFWFCRSASKPPWVEAQVVSESRLRITVAGNSWEVEAETSKEAQEAAIRFLSAFSEEMGVDIGAPSPPPPAGPDGEVGPRRLKEQHPSGAAPGL